MSASSSSSESDTQVNTSLDDSSRVLAPSLVTPSREGPATRSTSNKASLHYVTKAGVRPNVTDATGFVVVLDASITALDGPIVGIVGEPVSVKSKGKSQRSGVYVRELFEGVIGDIPYVVDKAGLEFITAARHAADMDNLLYRHGRLLDHDIDELFYGQVVELEFDSLGTPNGLFICPRGTQGKENWIQTNPWEFRSCSQLEYLLNYGAGEKESRHNLVTRWGLAINARVGKAKDLKTLIGSQKGRPSVLIDFKETVSFLSEDGDEKNISTDDYC